MSVARNDFIHVCVLMQRVYTQIALTVFYRGLIVHGGRLKELTNFKSGVIF